MARVMIDNWQEVRWVVRAQSGDADAFDALLKEVQEPLYHYLFRLVSDHHLALDILQDVLEGMTLQEVADVLEISLAAVKSRLTYGLGVLRKKLGAGRE